MKKVLGVVALCSAMLFSSSLVLAQDHQDHRPGPQSGAHEGFHDQGVREGWYKKGGHVPATYRGGNYVVNDWRAQRLHQPPRGYHWVRSDNGDFLLVAVTTGVIASIVAGAVQ